MASDTSRGRGLSGPPAANGGDLLGQGRMPFGGRFRRVVLSGLCGLGLGATSAAQDENREHVVVFAPQAPVFLTLDFDSGSQNIRAIRQKYAASQFRQLDRDGNGTLSKDELDAWKELKRSNPVLEPVLAKIASAERTTLENFSVLVEESLGPAFQVIADRKRLDQSVDLFPMLDRDGDGRLSAEEIQDGIAALRRTDFDDDETLSVAELQPFPRSIVEARRQQAATETPDIPVQALSTPAERQAVAKRLLETYRERPGSSSVPYSRLGADERSFFSTYDADRDGELNRDELAAWLESKPVDAVLQVAIDRSRITIPEAKFSPAVSKGTATIASRPTLVLAGMNVDFVAKNNRADQADNVYFYKLDFRKGDTDKNGYLDEMEFAAAGMRGLLFATVDADGNKQVTLSELVQYAEAEGQIAQAKLVILVGDEAKSLFQIIDKDLDRRLTMREFRTAPAGIRALDRDRNGLAPAELVSRYRLRFQYGTPDRMQRRGGDDVAASGVPITRTPSTSGPTWFRRMDRNQDGDLTWREFLGERRDFGSLDENKDGLIDLDEAMAGDQRLRTPAETPAPQ